MDLFCPVEGCGCHYLRRRDLKHHVVKKHPTYPATSISRNRSSKDGKEFPCPYDRCPCGYAHLRDFQRHLNSKHWPENPSTEAGEQFFCPHDDCRREYARMSDLRRHLAEKHGSGKVETRFPCSHSGCDRNYSRMGALQRHLEMEHPQISPLPEPSIPCDPEIFILPASSTPDEPPPEPLDPPENQWVTDFNFPLLLETV